MLLWEHKYSEARYFEAPSKLVPTEAGPSHVSGQKVWVPGWGIGPMSGVHMGSSRSLAGSVYA
jgi:hypothetical protein